MKTLKRIWILIADGARARVYKKAVKGLEHISNIDYVHAETRLRDRSSDKPGRGFDSTNGSKHAYSTGIDEHAYHRQLFAAQIGEALAKAQNDNEYDSLIILAPAEMLGDIRKELTKNVSKTVQEEINHNVTKLSDHDLYEYLQKKASTFLT